MIALRISPNGSSKVVECDRFSRKSKVVQSSFGLRLYAVYDSEAPKRAERNCYVRSHDGKTEIYGDAYIVRISFHEGLKFIDLTEEDLKNISGQIEDKKMFEIMGSYDSVEDMLFRHGDELSKEFKQWYLRRCYEEAEDRDGKIHAILFTE